MEDLHYITKFNGENFEAWEFQMRLLLAAEELGDYVSGKKKQPTADPSSFEARQWTKDNAKAMLMIAGAMTSNQLNLLITCDTAHEMWTKLTTLYQRKDGPKSEVIKCRARKSKESENTYVASTGIAVVEYAGHGAGPTRAETKILRANIADVWQVTCSLSHHLTFRRDWLMNFKSGAREKIIFADGSTFQATGIGSVQIEKLVDGKWVAGRMENVLYVPNMKRNLLSLAVVASRGFKVVFNGDEVKIMGSDETVNCRGMKQKNNLYRMFMRAVQGN